MGMHRRPGACALLLYALRQMIASFICALSCYFSAFQVESLEAMNYIASHRDEINTSLENLKPEERNIALAIVAPELSQYSTVYDFMELSTLYALYVSTGSGNFSVGPFQMKPSFAEELENYINANIQSAHTFSSLTPNGSEKEQRRKRLNRLSTLEGELEYLALFIEAVRRQTADIIFSDDIEKLRYWATLYNSGLSLTPENVKKAQAKKLFPRFNKSFNYADVAVEFYRHIISIPK